MKNDSVQEKQDVDKDENTKKEKVKTEKGKQDKADKVDNVQEKQDNDKEEIGEDEFWNTQFTDSQDDYMFKWKKEGGKKYDEVKQYKAFSDTMKNEFKKDDELKKMKDLEMAFFPINAHEHYYLVVFNFLKGTTVIIDNSKTPMSYEAKYKEVCDVLKNMFSMHLKEVQHQRAKDVLNKKPTILRPKWGTKDNNTDYGDFLMMHIENYNGETARNWNLEFPTEEKGNTYDIIKMRMRFVTKMLTHEINIHRENISKEALEFTDRNKEKKAREALLLKVIRVKKQKQESERVTSAI
ncbi:ulp1 protease family, C-terminal catalytic domain-containing protein [Tanacetum coccineum]